MPECTNESCKAGMGKPGRALRSQTAGENQKGIMNLQDGNATVGRV
jgi:hypothetical protein